MEYLSTAKEIDKIKVGVTAVEVIGYVSSVSAPTLVGDIKKYKIFKFMITNRKDKSIQCKVWGEDIEQVESKITVGSVLHINGAWAADVKPRYNQGNVPFELTIKKETEITIIEADEEQPDQSMNTDPFEIIIQDSAEFLNKLVVMKGYVKTNFQKITKSGYSSYGSAVVANDGYMLELRVTQYLPNADIHVGDLLKITGTIRDIVDKYGHYTLYLNVADNSGIEKIAGSRKSSLDLIKFTKSPKRKDCSSSDESEDDKEKTKKKKADKKAPQKTDDETKGKNTEKPKEDEKSA